MSKKVMSKKKLVLLIVAAIILFAGICCSAYSCIGFAQNPYQAAPWWVGLLFFIPFALVGGVLLLVGLLIKK